MPEIRHTKVVGVTYKNEDGSSRQSIIRKYGEPDATIILERDYENEFSDHAVAVKIIDDDFEERQIGYLSEEFAEKLYDKLEQVRCVVKDITGGEEDKKTLGVNLEMAIFSDEEYQEWQSQKQKAVTPVPPSKLPLEPIGSAIPKPIIKAQPPTIIQKNISPKSRTTTLVLCILLGYFGGHQFYAGRKTMGIVYIFTLGLFTIGWIIDFIMIITGNYKDKEGRLITTW